MQLVKFDETNENFFYSYFFFSKRCETIAKGKRDHGLFGESGGRVPENKTTKNLDIEILFFIILLYQ